MVRKIIGLICVLAAGLPVPLEVWAGTGGELKRSTIGLRRASNARFYLRPNNMGPASALETPAFGNSNDWGISGDWNGNDQDTIGLFRVGAMMSDPAQFFFSNSNTDVSTPTSKLFGNSLDEPLVGNWDGGMDGDKIGVWRPGALPADPGTFYLADGTTGPLTAQSQLFGNSGDIPISGNWDGSLDGSDEIGLFRPSTNQFFLRSNNIGPATVTTQQLGGSGDIPVAGDWDRDGTDTIGVFRPSNNTFYLTNSTSGGVPPVDVQQIFGDPGDLPVIGDWDGPGVDSGP